MDMSDKNHVGDRENKINCYLRTGYFV